MKSSKSYRIMIVDDDPDILLLFSRWLSAEGFDVVTAASGEAALERLHIDVPRLVITDLFMGEMSGMDLLASIHADNPLLPVIMLSGQAQIPDAVKATHMGSSAFLIKPVKQPELIDNVKRALRIGPELQDHNSIADAIIYKSKKMGELIELAQMVADSDITVFISGATGTGKEILAKAIHKASPRRDYPFVAVNCGAIPEQLLESELFGHEKGAFTGANVKHEGLFKSADKGTIFLDEIGDMPLSLQVKLLRVLQDLEVRPVGSTRSYPINVRIISATHRDLDAIVKQGEFREDLYYRLKVVPLQMMSLSERREDIPLLAAHFLQRHNKPGVKKQKNFAPEALEYLTQAPWPGNIRQLINIVDQCATLSKTGTITLNLVQRALQCEPARIQTLKNAKQEFERNYLVSVMKITNGHVANAAKIAGKNRTEFYKLLNQYEIEADEFRSNSSVIEG
ncbi:MAG: response regulator [Gammaproteobacteria bacterium]|nr:MAG: response regulator [Gammaproteobacteria bacterium]